MTKLQKSEINENKTQFTLKNNIYVSANGILTMKDNFGKIVFSENISEKVGKSKLSVFSVLLKNEK